MSFGLGHGRELDDAPGAIGITDLELPILPDEAMTNPLAGRTDPRQWFKDPTRPLEIEIGCGKGTFILEQARRDPQTNFLGIEWAREFYLYAADRVRRAGLTNVRMLRADATEFLRWRCPDELARVIHLYFSDPWPKKKHHKNRVVQDRFLGEAWRVLAPGGELRIVTDHDELWDWDQEHFNRWTTLAQPAANWTSPTSAPPFEFAPFVPPEWVGDGQLVGTNYERKMCDGKAPFAGVLRKKS
jgi:tRNA (guanine-N7-)-methyltransferase